MVIKVCEPLLSLPKGQGHILSAVLSTWVGMGGGGRKAVTNLNSETESGNVLNGV